MFDPVEEIMREKLRGEKGIPSRTKECPSERQLWDYLNGASGEREGKMADHLVRCEYCLKSLLLAQEVRPGIGFGPSEGPPHEVLSKAIGLAKKGKAQKSTIRKFLWLFLSLFFIGASFFFHRYFFQCLTLGVIFGVKWVFDTATTRTLIVMYEALKKRGSGEESSKDVQERMTKK